MAGTPKRSRHRTRRRPCLRCEAVFSSEGAHHRLCAHCREQLKVSPEPAEVYHVSRPRRTIPET